MDNTHSGRFAIMAAVLMTLASMLGIAAGGDTVFETDVRLGQHIQRWQGSLPQGLEHLGDMSGGTITAIAAVIGGIVIAAARRARRLVAFLIIVGILRVVGMGLKPLFASPRPLSGQLEIHEIANGFGYPSGHSMTAAMITTMVAMIAWHAPIARWTRWAITGGAIVFALLVGWSRVWVGAHWPTDVLGGWSYGVALVLLAWAITTRVAHSRTW